MIDIRKEIVALINKTTRLNCYYVAPPKDAEFPCVVYNEVVNSDYAIAEENEYANLSYQFTVYTQDPTNIFAIVDTIDRALRDVGFRKDYTSPDMYSDGYYSKTIRFKAIINHKGEIFNNN